MPTLQLTGPLRTLVQSRDLFQLRYSWPPSKHMPSTNTVLHLPQRLTQSHVVSSLLVPHCEDHKIKPGSYCGSCKGHHPPQDTTDFNPFSVLPQNEEIENLAPPPGLPPEPEPTTQVATPAASTLPPPGGENTQY